MKIYQKRWVHDIIVCVFYGWSDSKFDCCDNYVLRYEKENAFSLYHMEKKFQWLYKDADRS